MTSEDIRIKFRHFFGKQGHKWIPPAPLVPENDPTTLFTSSGMQPLVPYLLGQPHPEGKRLANSQPSLRLEDIEEVGDNRHTTFFEMLGNWSLGDYFKKEQLAWFWEFLTKELGLDPQKLYVTLFEGNDQVSKDTASEEIWKNLGVSPGHIFFYGVENNWWSRSGIPEQMPPGEIGGPDSEVFYEFTQVEHDKKYGEKCHPNCNCGRFLEIGNSVFIQYQKQVDGSLKELPNKNVDFGGGLERLTAVTNDISDIFQIDLFKELISSIEKNIFKKFFYQDNNVKSSFRILADHIRAISFILASGVLPSNKGQGYVLRRLIRRSVMQKYKWGSPDSESLSILIDEIVKSYKDIYPFIKDSLEMKKILDEEENKFTKTLRTALNEWHKLSLPKSSGLFRFGTQKFGEGPADVPLTPEKVFKFITTYGLPLDIIKDELHWKGDYEKLETLLKEHQEKSRTTSIGMFKGGLADQSEITTKYHSATHLLHAALRKILGEHVQQKGSNITAERLRFDFSHSQKMTEEELKRVENLVNEQIENNLKVTSTMMSKDDALQSGALGFFTQKYEDKVTVYMIGDFSKEICGGPHVDFTGKLGTFRIIKEESAGSGIRRIYATFGGK